MKLLLLTVVKRIKGPLCGLCPARRCLSSAAASSSSSLLRPADEALITGSSPALVQALGSQVQVWTEFISEEEEDAFMRELEPGLRKKRYEFDHWDDVSSL